MPACSSALCSQCEIPPQISNSTPNSRRPRTIDAGSLSNITTSLRSSSAGPSRRTRSKRAATSKTGDTRPWQLGTAISTPPLMRVLCQSRGGEPRREFGLKWAAMTVFGRRRPMPALQVATTRPTYRGRLRAGGSPGSSLGEVKRALACSTISGRLSTFDGAGATGPSMPPRVKCERKKARTSKCLHQQSKLSRQGRPQDSWRRSRRPLHGQAAGITAIDPGPFQSTSAGSGFGGSFEPPIG